MKYYKRFWNKISGRYNARVMEKCNDACKQMELSKRYSEGTDYVLDFACGLGIAK